MSGRLAEAFRRISRAGHFVEDATLALLLGAMIALAAAQILLRNVFGIGIVWSDELLRLMLLWLALLGAVAASRNHRHIDIDVLSRLLPAAVAPAVFIVRDLFTAGVCAVAAWHAAFFVADSRAFEDTVLVGVPAWPFQLILPVGFGLIALRYAGHVLLRLLGRSPDPEST